MDRDPSNYECTIDPIFLLQVGFEQLVEVPDGLNSDCDGGFYVSDPEVLDSWITPLVSDGWVDEKDLFDECRERQTYHGWPMVHTEWSTERVFLTRKEAETWAKARDYRWEKWRVYCVPCQGDLAKVLNEA